METEKKMKRLGTRLKDKGRLPRLWETGEDWTERKKKKNKS